jgi:predicted amidophosphoribosyltransferase
MPSVFELSAPYGNFMLGPRRGPGVCATCFDLTGGPPRCHHCAHPEPALDAMVPVSYSVAHEQLHHALAGYKRPPAEVAARFELELAAVLWRFIARHEACVAAAAGTAGFELVTTVPSSTRERDAHHPLHRIVGERVEPTRARYERVLLRTGATIPPRTISAEKFATVGDLENRSVLLIDDTWTTGASARSAAVVLKRAGASRVGAVIVGRHLHRHWGQNDRGLKALPAPFDWNHCALHGSR